MFVFWCRFTFLASRLQALDVSADYGALFVAAAFEEFASRSIAYDALEQLAVVLALEKPLFELREALLQRMTSDEYFIVVASVFSNASLTFAIISAASDPFCSRVRKKRPASTPRIPLVPLAATNQPHRFSNMLLGR